ncbi:caspase-6-like [Antedon mediterranea]|uniref:caspase-6-like n=1 Tax=Antedon mediterranea TaxID=105859 RepID=UPI003AF6B9B2
MADQSKNDNHITENDALFASSRPSIHSSSSSNQQQPSTVRSRYQTPASEATASSWNVQPGLGLMPDYSTSSDVPSILQGIDKNLLSYNMSHPKRGVAVIFNHEEFHLGTQMPRRRGTQHDVDNLKKRLTKLQFDVKVHQDLTVVQLWDALKNVSLQSHADSDCFVCVFLTHGDNDVIYAYDGVLKLQELIDRFRGEKCKSLVGKPKIFLIQACRGEDHEIGIDAMDGLDDVELMDVDVADAGPRPTVPAGADFLLAYSVAEGYYSHRDTAYGSWFIQALSFVMERYGTTMEFTDMLLLVNHIVSQRSVKACRDPAMIGKKQVPCFMSMLTKKLYFAKK